MNHVSSNLPACITAGVRMKYPSCYVLLVDDRPDAHRPVMPSPGLMGSGQVDDGLLEPGSRVKGMEPLSEVTEKTNRLFSSRMVEKITQDSVITAGLSKRWEVLCHTNEVRGSLSYKLLMKDFNKVKAAFLSSFLSTFSYFRSIKIIII